MAPKQISWGGNLGIYKGAIYENIVADILSKQGGKLYFYVGARSEIDFVIRDAGDAASVEVKSAENRREKTMGSLLENRRVGRGIKLSAANQGKSGVLETIPLHLSPFLSQVERICL